MANSLTAAFLREVLSYDPETGVWVWVKPNTNAHRVRLGTIAGTIHKYGYRHIGIEETIYRAPRLAFLYMTGEWPAPNYEVDHVDRDRGNDRWSNLRLVTSSQNKANRRTPKNNSSGFKGVQWDKKRNKWVVFITVDGKRKYLGVFDDAALAGAAYDAACKEFFGAEAV